MNTKELIKNTFGAVLALTIIIFAVVLTVYGCSGIADPFKETLTITIGFFGGFTTLGAAFIAANLFDDWRVIEDHKSKNEHINNAKNSFLDLQNFLKMKSMQVMYIQAICRSQAISDDNKVELLSIFNEFQLDILYSLRSIKIHIHFFAKVTNNLILCGELEQILDNLDSQSQVKYETLIRAIHHQSPPQILNSFEDYFKYTNETLVIDLHSKIILRLADKINALE